MSDRSDPDPANLADLVDDLETTLRSLREVVEDEPDGRERHPMRRTPPRPPSLGDLVRFTERYTIPALVASLEATIRALELFRAVLRLADPERDLDADREADTGRSSVDVAGDLASATGTKAASELRRRLAGLREELAAADQPRDEEARETLQEARELTDELERRLREAGRDAGGVTIDVDGGDGDADNDGAGSTAADDVGDADDSPGGTVDVDAELHSIKEDLGKEPAVDRGADDEESGDDVAGEGAGDQDAPDDDPDIEVNADDDADGGNPDDADGENPDDADDSP